MLINIPQELKDEPRWVNCNDKKIPCNASGGFAKINKPETWSTFEKAKSAIGKTSRKGNKINGLGFVLTDDDDVLCIDLDKCVDKDTGEIQPAARKVMELLDSYTEISRSGTGLHIFVRSTKPNDLKSNNNKFNWECYENNRFIVMTGNVVEGRDTIKSTAPSNITTARAFIIPQDKDIIEIKTLPSSIVINNSKLTTSDIACLPDALDHIDNGEYAVWLKVGMALHTLDDKAYGRELWDKWSLSSPKYCDKAQEETWRSFNDVENGITVGTIFHIAFQNGYNKPYLGNRLHDEYIYVSDCDMYFNIAEKLLYSRQAFRAINRYEFSGVKGNPLADVAFDNASPDIKRIARAKAFLPSPNEIIKLHGIPYVNTYKGFAVSPKEGDVSEFIRLAYFICGEHTEYVLDHLAFTVQKPLEKIRWGILLAGEPRSGKSMLLRPIHRIFGDAGASIDPKAGTTGWDNVYCEKKALVFEEVWQPNNRSYFNEIKTKLANDDIDLLNPKCERPVTQQNLYSIYMCTNHLDALAFDINEDKLMVINTPPAKDRWEPKRYKALADAIDGKHNQLSPNGEYLHNILHYLIQRDVSKFSNGVLPIRTQGTIDMVKNGRPDYEAAIEELHSTQTYPFNMQFFTIAELKRVLIEEHYSCGNKGIKRALTILGYAEYRGTKKVDGKIINSPSFYTNNSELTVAGVSQVYEWWDSKK